MEPKLASGKATKMELNDLTNVDGTPNSGQVLKFDGKDWTPATDETGTGGSTLWKENGDDIFYNNGKVGIGTDVPAYPLDILTSTSISISTKSAGPNNFIPLSNTTGFRGYSGIRSNDMEVGTMVGNNTGKVHITTNEQPRLTVASDGKVGIGTTSPTTELDIMGNIRTSSLAGTGKRNVVADANGNLTIDMEGSSIWEKGTGNNIFYNSGNVGIGTSSPTHPLQISSSNSESIKIQSTGTDNWIGFHTSEGYQGYAGISWNDKDMDFGTGLFNTTGKVHLVTNAIPKLTVATNGNVGIGTTSPEVKLDVRGGEVNLISREGDFRIGNSTHRLKIGVATDGPEAGRANIRSVGGINELYLAAGLGLETLRIKENAVEVTKELNRPSTGNADLIPVAYGTIKFDGTILNGTGNFRVERPGPIGFFLIIIDFVNYSTATHTSLVTLQTPGQRSFIDASSAFVSGGNALAVNTYVLRDNGVENGRQFLSFSFVVYKQ
jgi:hypothetical protein